MKKLAVLLLLLLPALPAAADDAAALYDKGDYAHAMQAGEAAHNAAGYAVAARAALSEAVLRDAPCLECLQHAEVLAQQAVAADAKSADGQTWLAAALGYQTRIKGVAWAQVHGVPGRARAALDAAVAAEPSNPHAVSALGAWHVEVVKGAGPFLGRTLYGATLGAAMPLFDRAVKLAPGDAGVRYQIALALAALDPDANRARIAAELDAAVRGDAATAYDKALQARAAELKTLLLGSRAAFDAKVRKFQGYP
jgi:hypothetical protein